MSRTPWRWTSARPATSSSSGPQPTRRGDLPDPEHWAAPPRPGPRRGDVRCAARAPDAAVDHARGVCRGGPSRRRVGPARQRPRAPRRRAQRARCASRPTAWPRRAPWSSTGRGSAPWPCGWSASTAAGGSRPCRSAERRPGRRRALPRRASAGPCWALDVCGAARPRASGGTCGWSGLAPWHILNFLPEPQGHGPLRDATLSCSAVSWCGGRAHARCSTSPVSARRGVLQLLGRRTGCSRPLARNVGVLVGGLRSRAVLGGSGRRPRRPACRSDRRSSSARASASPTSRSPASMSETLIGCTAGAGAAAGRRRPGR